MYLELALAGIMVGEYIYHRLTETQPTPPPAQSLSLPITATGGVVPMLYGRCRVRAPILAWVGVPRTATTDGVATSPVVAYGIQMFFVLGVPFQNGSARLWNVWMGDRILTFVDALPQAGIGGFELAIQADLYTTIAWPNGAYGGYIELLNGNPMQTLVDGSGDATCVAGQKMLDDGIAPTLIPAYRNYISALLFEAAGEDGSGRVPTNAGWLNLRDGSRTLWTDEFNPDVVPGGPGNYDNPSNIKEGWIFGADTQVNPVSFEVSSYPQGLGSGLIDNDVNPIDVIFDVLTSTFGKLGLDPSTRLDMPSFVAAATTLNTEGHGYSRSVESSTTALDLITEICAQIDAVMYEDTVTGLIGIKLIRPDYDVGSLALITPENCEELQNFAMGGWTDVPNQIQVVFTNRADNYQPGSSTSQSQGNAVGQDGETRLLVLQMPGVTTQDLADQIVSRELQARSRPLMKCRAIVNREFLRAKTGDVYLLTWPEANISRVVMRVGAAGRGTLENGQISLDLIQDYFYQWRARPPLPPIKTSLGGGSLILGG